MPTDLRKKAVFGIALAALISPPAWGYIDPGTSGIILQMVLGAAIGALFYVKRATAYVTQWFRGSKTDG